MVFHAGAYSTVGGGNWGLSLEYRDTGSEMVTVHLSKGVIHYYKLSTDLPLQWGEMGFSLDNRGTSGEIVTIHLGKGVTYLVGV